MGHKRERNKVIDVTPVVNMREKLIAELKQNGFNPDQMTETDLAMLAQVGEIGNEIIEAIDTVGQVVFDYLEGGETV
jgi:hypothetical protein